MIHQWFPASSEALLGNLWVANPMKVALLVPAFVPNPDVQKVWADISASEIAPSGPYVAGGMALTTRTATYDAANDRTNYLADDNVIGPGFTTDAGFAVVYDSSGAKPLWSLVNFQGTKSIVAGTLTIDWASIAILYAVAV